MAFKNKLIRNPITGQDIRFLQTAKDTDGKLLEMEATYNAMSKEPIPHYHPHQEEFMKILSGEVSIRMDGKVRVLKEGDAVHIPKNKVHSMWNATGEKATMLWKVVPAMDTEYLLETATGLARDGRTNDKGMPNILQTALTISRFDNVFRLANPPYIVQRIIFFLLTPIAWLSCYRPVYKKYLD